MQMKAYQIIQTTIAALISLGMCSCEPKVDPSDDDQPQIINTPFTDIPEELTGIWYADHNEGPLTVNWEQGTFQGEQGYREFRTMVFTKNGKNAVEYSTQTYNSGDEVKQYIFKINGTLKYKADSEPPT